MSPKSRALHGLERHCDAVARTPAVRRHPLVSLAAVRAVDAAPDTLPPVLLDLHLNVEEVVVEAGLPAVLRAPLPRVVADWVDHLGAQKVRGRYVVHDEVGRQPDQREVDLRERDEKPDDRHHDGVARVHLDDHQAHPLGIRNVHRLVVLHRIQNKRRHAVARERRDRRAEEGVDRHTPPLAPRVERHAKQTRVIVGAK